MDPDGAGSAGFRCVSDCGAGVCAHPLNASAKTASEMLRKVPSDSLVSPEWAQFFRLSITVPRKMLI
jgi:hypothetical protein